ncbi:TIGR00266 family protein [Breznakiellaceae bacterium SP9]
MKHEIKGSIFPVVICNLDAGEQVTCETGAMLWMSPNMQMATSTGGGIGKMFTRAISGEGLFVNQYTAGDGKPGMIAFGPKNPGEIHAVDVSAQSIKAQKGSFLASSSTVQTELAFQKKIGTALFGGDFILQQYKGSGTVFLAIDGGTVQYTLSAGEKLLIDSNAFAFAESSINIDIERVKGLANMLGGGEGAFNTVLTGPGTVWLQTMPMSVLAAAINQFLPKK